MGPTYGAHGLDQALTVYAEEAIRQLKGFRIPGDAIVVALRELEATQFSDGFDVLSFQSNTAPLGHRSNERERDPGHGERSPTPRSPHRRMSTS